MSLPRLIASALVAALTLACDSDDLPGPAGADPSVAATRACGPADGPAVAIYFAASAVTSIEPPPPFVRVYVPEPLDQLPGRSWVLAGRSAEGGAWRHSSATEFEGATSGRLWVTSVARDSTMEGFVDVTFPSTGRLRRAFRARWFPQSFRCG